MKIYKLILPFLLMSFLIVLGCTNSSKEPASSETSSTKVSDTITNIDNKEQFDLEIDDVYLQIWDEKDTERLPLGVSEYKLSEFTRLKQGQDQFTYYLLDKLNLDTSFNTCLIYESYEFERSVWLANFTLNGQLIDALEVYYDNAEGAWLTTASIKLKEKKIRINEYNAYNDPENKIINIEVLPTGKFKEIQ